MPPRSNRTFLAFILTALASALAAGACAPQESAGVPTAPTTVSVATTYIELRGLAADTAFRGVQGVTVEILEGAAIGTTVVSGNTTLFSVMVPTGKDVTLRLSKDGYLANTVTTKAPTSQYNLTTFYLAPNGPVAPISDGPYTLTIAADSSCSVVPPALRTQTFLARLEPFANAPPGAMHHVVVEKQSALYFTSNFTIGSAGNYLGLYPFSDLPLEWQLAPLTFFSAGPSAAGLSFTGWNPNLLSFEAVIEYGEMYGLPPLYIGWWDVAASNFKVRGTCPGRVALTP